MRLIDADALDIEREVELADDWNTAHEIANCVKYAPTIDAVPVVRCKDCKHWCTDSMPRMQDANVHFCVMVDFYSTADWFCAYGELKEG